MGKGDIDACAINSTHGCSAGKGISGVFAARRRETEGIRSSELPDPRDSFDCIDSHISLAFPSDPRYALDIKDLGARESEIALRH